MAVYLPVRPISRSQNLRVGQPPSAVSLKSQTTTYYVDLSNGTVRRDLMHHMAIGAVVVVGPLSANNQTWDVWTGAGFTAGVGLNNSTVATGELRSSDTGLYVPIVQNTGVTFTANASGNPRIDLVVVDQVTGVVSVVAGTAAASPVAPATPAGKTALYQVTIVNAATAPGTTVDVRPRF